MTYIVGAFVLEFDDAYAWATKHAPDEMNLKRQETFVLRNRGVL